MTDSLWLNPDRCRGCLRCELACSLHHSGNQLYQPSLSSTRVSRNNENRKITMTLDSTCDGCTGEAVPHCVLSCPFNARGVSK